MYAIQRDTHRHRPTHRPGGSRSQRYKTTLRGAGRHQRNRLIIRGSWVQVPPALLTNTAFDLGFLGSRRPRITLLIMAGCSVVALVYGPCSAVDHLERHRQLRPHDDQRKIKPEGLYGVADQQHFDGRSSPVQVGSSCHHTARDQQIKDPLLLAALFSARSKQPEDRSAALPVRQPVKTKRQAHPKDRRACLGSMVQVVLPQGWVGRVISRAVWAPVAAVLTRAAVDSAAARAYTASKLVHVV